MTYKATAMLPIPDTEKAVAGLSGRLRMLAAQDGAAPDWSTLRVAGPTQTVGARGVFWFEWVASVDASLMAVSPG